MDPAKVTAVLLGLPETTEEEPFRPDLPVYKVAGKVFAIFHTESSPATITLKCDAARAEYLRQRYPAIAPGYHTNKRLWNTITLDGSVPEPELVELMRHAYEEAAAGLRKADRERVLGRLHQLES